jgi:hypothetical protein
MKPEEDVWGWMLSTDFFLAGMGGAMLVIAALIDLLSVSIRFHPSPALWGRCLSAWAPCC